jgi:hypothetical protein
MTIIFTAMTRIRKLLAALWLAATLPASAVAQAPIAGSGDLPGIDPLARPSRVVVDAVEKIMGDRTVRGPFLLIRTCFEEAGRQTALLQVCRQRLVSYFRSLVLDQREALGGLPQVEVYVRLIELANDPDAAVFMKGMFALRGIVNDVDQAQRFSDIKDCYRDAGPQPAFRQICRQRLERFHSEIAATRALDFRDVKPEAILKRLQELADSGSALAGGGAQAFESLRNIRKAQQEEAIKAQQALAAASAYYCPAPASRQASLESRMADTGICLCGYGRRYIAPNPLRPGAPVLAGSRSCGEAGRFRIRDLNGGVLSNGDWVTVQGAHGGYLSVAQNGAVQSDKTEAGKFERFRIFRVSGIAGRIQPGEMLTLVSPRGMFVSANVRGGGILAGSRERPGPYDYFVLVPD